MILICVLQMSSNLLNLKKTVISIRLDADVLKVLDTLSNDTDISRNELIVQCIDYALKNFHQ